MARQAVGETIVNDAVAIALFGSFTKLVCQGDVLDAHAALRRCKIG